MRGRIRLALFAMLGALGLVVVSADAGTATSPMAVTMAVGNTCTISAGPLAYGNYDPIVTNKTAPLNGQATLTVTCTSGAAFTVTLDQGVNPAAGSTATAPLRQVSDGATPTPHVAAYGLFRDAAHTLVWGNTAAVGLTGTGTGAAQSLTVFGSVNGGQNVPQASYSDSVLSTITF